MKANKSKIHIAPSKNKEEKKVKITFENDLTIYSIEDFKAKFIEAYNKYDVINIKLKNVNNVDLTFIQLLYSLKEDSKKTNKSISFDFEFPEDLELLLNNSDLSKVFRKL
ncbi:MAG: hypothetical protein JEY96_01845 [Bacteroidales bacterium]|jgi:ABC-type transporter Mla MlaB component|nr:hypothetical protein [Bacteroidales bacterium]